MRPVRPARTHRQQRPQKAPLWRRALKAVMLALFLLIGSVESGRPSNGVFYSSTSDIVQSLIVGAMIAVVVLAVIGSIGHVRAGRRGIQRPWLASATTFQVLVTILVLVLAASALRTTLALSRELPRRVVAEGNTAAVPQIVESVERPILAEVEAFNAQVEAELRTLLSTIYR